MSFCDDDFKLSKYTVWLSLLQSMVLFIWWFSSVCQVVMFFSVVSGQTVRTVKHAKDTVHLSGNGTLMIEVFFSAHKMMCTYGTSNCTLQEMFKLRRGTLFTRMDSRRKTETVAACARLCAETNKEG